MQDNKRQQMEAAPLRLVKLNVGGTRFETSLQMLRRYPSTYFTDVFGEHNDDNTSDDEHFFQAGWELSIDRDPTLFHIILEYMRTGHALTGDLTPTQLKALELEVEFYKIFSFAAVYGLDYFSADTKGDDIKLSKFNSIARMEQIKDLTCVLSDTPFTESAAEKRIKLVNGGRIFVGVTLNRPGQTAKWYQLQGYMIATFDGGMYYADRMRTSPPQGYMEPIPLGSTVSIKLDRDRDLSIKINNSDWMLAFKNVYPDEPSTAPIHLCVTFGGTSPSNDIREVQLLSA